MGKCAGANDGPIAPENQRQPLALQSDRAGLLSVVFSTRLTKKLHVRSTVLVTRQPPANDSDTFGMSQLDTFMTPISLTCPALTGGAFPEIPTMSHTITVTRRERHLGSGPIKPVADMTIS